MRPCLWGLLTVGALWAAAGFMSWHLDPRVLIRGADGRPSSSKLQCVLWTSVVMFSYVSVFAAAAARSGWQIRLSLPDELLAGMGLGGATLVGAKAITIAQVANGKIAKTPVAGARASWLVTDDAGNPDFVKLQMLAWTAIAVGTYLLRSIALVRNLPPGDVQLPTIDRGLVLVCGIAHAAYLSNKLVSTEAPRLTGISPASGHAPLLVTITGTALGQRDGAALILDGAPVAAFVSVWSEDRIEVTLPPTRPDGTPWPKDRAVSLGLMTGGRTSANNVLFTFA